MLRFRRGWFWGCHVTTLAAQEALKLIAGGSLTFDARVVPHRVGTGAGSVAPKPFISGLESPNPDPITTKPLLPNSYKGLGVMENSYGRGLGVKKT